MALSSSNAAKQLSDGNSQGTILGQSSTDLIAFYGGTPRARPTGATSNAPVLATTLTIGVAVGSSAGIGFSSVALFGAYMSTVAFLQTDVQSLQANLNALHQAMSSTGFTAGA